MTFEEMDIDSIIEQVLSYDCDRVVFTGGEPALQDLSIIGKRLKGTRDQHINRDQWNNSNRPYYRLDMC